MIDRESGYYWVKIKDEWDIYYWSSDHKRWCFPNNPIRFHDGVFKEIGNKVERFDTAHLKGLLEKNLLFLNVLVKILRSESRASSALRLETIITEIQNALK